MGTNIFYKNKMGGAIKFENMNVFQKVNGLLD
jgi:hypothetical protein